MAKKIAQKYAPGAKKIAGMLFKSHNKSPSNLLSKIRSIKPSGFMKGIGKAFNVAKNIASDAASVGSAMGYDTSALQSGLNKADNVVNSYHNVLEKFN